MAFFSSIFGGSNSRAVGAFLGVVEKINALESQYEALSADALKAKTAEFKERIGRGEILDDLLSEAFAAVREASKRTLGQRHFDVQLMGGIALHQGKISEMRTGEGKTLVATLPSYLNALLGKGVHVVTVNDYLSRRDAVWMGQIYHALGLTTGILNHESSFVYDPMHGAEADKVRDTLGAFKVVHEFLRPVSRREAYAADITYGTNNEYGFDYLRDNMAYTLAQKSQRGFQFAIVDEVDSILIDEARTPLIISAPDVESGDLYRTFSKLVPKLTKGEDYTVDEKLKAAVVTEAGLDKVEGILGKKLYEGGMEAESARLVHHLEQALKADSLYQKDRDYVVREGQVIIVDEFTGRMMPGRRWSEGLHQAIEAKEGVEVQRESRTMATITFQNYFRMYSKLAGMTGTAATNAEEFHKVYNLDVISIPTHRENIRNDKSDLVFRTEKGKFVALAREVKRLNAAGAPVLIGTVSIEKNERLSEVLSREGVPHNVLNAKNHEKEAEIIAQAGKSGAVTVATNLAGRGVDIILGGNPPEAADGEVVRAAGGLHVFGTERHEARRIDNQLRGRAGRQGDPGVTQFYLSMEDDLMRVFGSDRIKGMMESLGIPEDESIENRMVSRAIESAQAKIEGFHFDARKHVLEFDDVMNRQREAIYRMRNELLESEENSETLKERVLALIKEESQLLARAHTSADDMEESIDELKKYLQAIIPGAAGGAKLEKINEVKELGRETAAEVLGEEVEAILVASFEEKLSRLGDPFRQAARSLLLQTIDVLWVDHLTQMDHLRDTVRLRAYGQRDPLVEYKNESVRLFRALQGSVRQYALQAILKIEASGERREPHTHTASQPNLIMSSAKETTTKDAIAASVYNPKKDKEPNRNNPCPCGSGKKYKKCGMLNTEEHQALIAKV